MFRRVAPAFHIGLGALLSLSALAAAPALAQARSAWTLDAALERARTQAPPALTARLRVAEAQGQLVGARRLADNPTLAGGLGRRLGVAGERGLEAEAQLMQPLELSGRRQARIQAAGAAVDAETANAEMTVRQLEADVAVAFYRTLAGREREVVARAAEQAARRAADALERRYQLRDVALLDVNLARGALARTSALVRSIQATRTLAEAELKQLLGLEDRGPLLLAGDLRDRRRFALPALLERAGQRAEIRNLMAQARQAQAEAAEGQAERWPGVGIGAAYERDEGNDIVLGLLSIELPLFDRGQGARTVGVSRARRLEQQADAARRASVAAIQGAYVAYQQQLEAVGALEAVMPQLDGTEELARKSYESGQLSLAEWMLVRGEAVETRMDYLEHQLAAAEAGVALANRAGVSP